MKRITVLSGLLLSVALITASPAAAANFNCAGVFTGQTYDDVTVQAGQSCTLVSSTVTGRVTARSNAYFEADATTVNHVVRGDRAQTLFVHNGSQVGGIVGTRTAQVYAFDTLVTAGGKVRAANASTTVNICGVQVQNGNIEVVESSSDVLVGDPLTSDCAGNIVGGDMNILRNSTDVELIVRGNTIVDDLTVNKNTGPSDKFVEANTGGDKLDCRNNAAPFFASGNNTWNQKKNQCAGP